MRGRGARSIKKKRRVNNFIIKKNTEKIQEAEAVVEEKIEKNHIQHILVQSVMIGEKYVTD
jgi:hypothetical protein